MQTVVQTARSADTGSQMDRTGLRDTANDSVDTAARHPGARRATPLDQGDSIVRDASVSTALTLYPRRGFVI